MHGLKLIDKSLEILSNMDTRLDSSAKLYSASSAPLALVAPVDLVSYLNRIGETYSHFGFDRHQSRVSATNHPLILVSASLASPFVHLHHPSIINRGSARLLGNRKPRSIKERRPGTVKHHHRGPSLNLLSAYLASIRCISLLLQSLLLSLPWFWPPGFEQTYRSDRLIDIEVLKPQAAHSTAPFNAYERPLTCHIVTFFADSRPARTTPVNAILCPSASRISSTKSRKSHLPTNMTRPEWVPSP